jgi:pyridoxamine 5'-phosphate oxidase
MENQFAPEGNTTPGSLSSIRRDYQKLHLNEDEVALNPLDQLQLWLNKAVNAGLLEPTAMHLATVGPDGQPSGRIVLLKKLDAGLVFFTNYLSRKGFQIAHNPLVSVTFFWDALERQVRVHGKAEKVTAEESDSYFASRPRASQLGSASSPQSQVVGSRQELNERLAELDLLYANKPVPRPEHWGGYRVLPHYFEFWQGGAGRMHDRLTYTQLEDAEWKLERLAP